VKRTCFFDSKTEPTRRYYLRITWDKTKSILIFLLLNPSKANNLKDDPTSGFLIEYAKLNGYGGIIIVNVISRIEPKSKNLIAQDSDCDLRNMRYVKRVLKFSNKIIVGWGEKGRLAVISILDILYEHKDKLYCFRQNNDKSPSQATYIIRYMNKHKIKISELLLTKFSDLPKR
jgi:hypothetical protein